MINTIERGMNRATLQDALDAKPCWLYDPDGREKIEELFAGRESLSAHDIAALPITHHEKVWALTRPIFMSTRKAVRAAIELAEQVVHIYESRHPGDERPRRACIVARKRIDKPSAVRAVEYKIACTDALLVAIKSPLLSTDESVALAALYAAEAAMKYAPRGRLKDRPVKQSMAREDAVIAIRYAIYAARRTMYGAQIDYLLQLIEEDEGEP
jgi:hypothetical protein